MCAYSVFNTFPVYPLSAKPLILLAFCRYRYHTSLFGVPVFACFYSAANFFLDVRLRHKDLPLDTGSYTTDSPKTNIKAPPQEKNL